MADLKSEGKTPSERERFIRVVMGLIKASIQDLSRKVGIMSRAHVESEDLEIASRTSVLVAGVKQGRGGGIVVDGR